MWSSLSLQFWKADIVARRDWRVERAARVLSQERISRYNASIKVIALRPNNNGIYVRVGDVCMEKARAECGWINTHKLPKEN
jgi:hypothetical protein